MAREVKLPELGEGVETGDVVKILVAPEQQVEAQQVLMELETDKAIVEVPAPVAGTIVKVLVQEGDEVAVGQAIVVMEEGARGQDAEQGKAQAPGAEDGKAQAAAEAADPSMDEDAQGEGATDEEPAPAPERPAARERTPAPERPPSAARPGAGSDASTAADLSDVPAAPSVRRLAREIGVDLRQVAGRGAGGRITAEDVKRHAREGAAPAAAPAVGDQRRAATATPDWAAHGEVRRESMSRVRRKTAEQMTAAWAEIPHVTHYDEADVSDLERQRKALAKAVEAAGGKLTMTAVILKVVALALKRFPKLNASLDMDAQEIIYRQRIHIGVAVDTERGLLVPVVRDVDELSLTDVAIELDRLAAQARTGKIDLGELRGAGFTVTNLGGIGGTNFAPLINPPEVAILGVSRARTQPVFQDGEFVPRQIMPFSLSYDHRLVDGADAARFCRTVAETLETPLRLLVEED